MGEIGTPTRILAGKFGAPFTYATFHHERQMAPGQLSYQQMIDIYHYDQINSETQVFGVIADPVGHSLSPIIHNEAFRHLNLNMVYVPFRVPREDLDEFMMRCRDLDVRGLSVTIPHKEEVLRNLDEADGAVSGIGAANTLVFEDEIVVGYNTDFHAAMDSLEEASRIGDSRNPLKGKVVLILGAGGVAKAIAFGLKRRQANTVIASRTKYRADQLAEQMGCRAVEWDERHSVKPDIVINGTPVGMHPHVNETPYDSRYLKHSTVVFDTVYNPEQTLLVKEARTKGCRVVTGVDMFVRQAAMQFEKFTGHVPPINVMREAVKRTTGAARQQRTEEMQQ
jgi:3-dehydroquinate dehydratase/shikimate dehydrogenase